MSVINMSVYVFVSCELYQGKFDAKVILEDAKLVLVTIGQLKICRQPNL